MRGQPAPACPRARRSHPVKRRRVDRPAADAFQRAVYQLQRHPVRAGISKRARHASRLTGRKAKARVIVRVAEHQHGGMPLPSGLLQRAADQRRANPQSLISRQDRQRRQ